MKSLLSLLLSLCFVPLCFGQTTTYKKAKIYLDNHQVVKVNNLKIGPSAANFLNATNNNEETLSLETISLIKKAHSSYFKEGALYGAGVMALTALLIDIQPDDPLGVGVEHDHGAGFYIGMIGGGAVFGALVGALFPKWKTIYSGGKFIGENESFHLDFNSKNNTFNLKLSITL